MLLPHDTADALDCIFHLVICVTDYFQAVTCLRPPVLIGSESTWHLSDQGGLSQRLWSISKRPASFSRLSNWLKTKELLQITGDHRQRACEHNCCCSTVLGFLRIHLCQAKNSGSIIKIKIREQMKPWTSNIKHKAFFHNKSLLIW